MKRSTLYDIEIIVRFQSERAFDAIENGNFDPLSYNFPAGWSFNGTSSIDDLIVFEVSHMPTHDEQQTMLRILDNT